MKRRAQDQKLADNARLLRSWHRWHREQLEAALAGIHRDVIERLLAQLNNLHSARALVNFIDTQDWAAVDANTRLIALHEIGRAITALRERNGLVPIDDPLPGAPENAFRIIKTIISSFPPHAGEHTEVSSANSGEAK
jgi:hypothetical protein